MDSSLNKNSTDLDTAIATLKNLSINYPAQIAGIIESSIKEIKPIRSLCRLLSSLFIKVQYFQTTITATTFSNSNFDKTLSSLKSSMRNFTNGTISANEVRILCNSIDDLLSSFKLLNPSVSASPEALDLFNQTTSVQSSCINISTSCHDLMIVGFLANIKATTDALKKAKDEINNLATTVNDVKDVVAAIAGILSVLGTLLPLFV